MSNNKKLMRVLLLAVILLCLMTGTAIAQNVSAESSDDSDEDPAAFGIDGFLGQLISTVVWVAIGLVLILLVIGTIDIITDKMKSNWLNLEELAGNPQAMAIFAGGMMIAIAIIIHASVSS